MAYKALAKRMYKQACDQKALKDGTQSLLRSEIIRCYDMYMERGYISIHGLHSGRQWNRYKTYEKIKGITSKDPENKLKGDGEDA